MYSNTLGWAAYATLSRIAGVRSLDTVVIINILIVIGDLLVGRNRARGSSDTDASQQVIAVPRHINKATTKFRAMIVLYILLNELTSISPLSRSAIYCNQRGVECLSKSTLHLRGMRIYFTRSSILFCWGE